MLKKNRNLDSSCLSDNNNITRALKRLHDHIGSLSPSFNKTLLCNPSFSSQKILRPKTAKVSSSPLRANSAKIVLKHQLAKKLISQKIRCFKGEQVMLSRAQKPVELGQLNQDQKQQVQQLSSQIQNIKIEKLLGLYLAKCYDYRIEYSSAQADIFIEKVKKYIHHRRFNLPQAGLGCHVAAVIKDIFLQNNNFFYLDLKKNNIRDEGAFEIAQIIALSKSLISLNLSSNAITCVGMQSIFKALKINSSVIAIDVSSLQGLNRNRVLDLGAMQIASCLKINCVIQFLNIANTSISIKGLQAIVSNINVNNSLVHLNISGNQFGKRSGQNLKSLMNKCRLQFLDISYIGLQDAGLQKFSEYFQELAKYSKQQRLNLKELRMSNNKLTLYSLNKFLSGFRRKTVLEKLILDGNNFSQNHPACLQKLLENQSFTFLSLKDCNIDTVGCLSLGAAFPKCNSIQRIYLGKNKLTLGINSMSRNLNLCRAIIYIDLSQCLIQDQNLISFARDLRQNSTLRTLNVKENFIRNPGAQQIISTLSVNKTLNQINLSKNFVSLELLLQISTVLKDNIGFKKVNLPDESIQRRRLEDIRKSNQQKDQKLKEQTISIQIEIQRIRNRIEDLKNQLNSKSHEQALKELENQKKQVTQQFEVDQARYIDKLEQVESKLKSFGQFKQQQSYSFILKKKTRTWN